MALIKSISGIRGTLGGVVGENLTPMDVVKFTAAFATMLKAHLSPLTSHLTPHTSHLTPHTSHFTPLTSHLIVGRDARPSGAMISNLVCATLQSLGVDVIDVGLSTTPTVEMAVVKHQATGGIIITASHNPGEWNALKLLNEKGEFISAEMGKQLLEIAEKEEFDFSSAEHLGNYSKYEHAIEDHISEILKLDLIDVSAIKAADFSVVFDAVNSTGGIVIPLLLDKLGVKNYKALYGEPTGIFPHNPEPLPQNLHEISSVMKNENFDVGFVVDPDVDRLAIVMENGEMFGEEYTLVAVTDYLLQQKAEDIKSSFPKSSLSVVSNLSSTRALRDVAEKHGVNYYASAVGEVNVVEKMKETHAVIGGEGNGGIILPELHYGRDALVGIALFLSFMAKCKLKCSEIKTHYPNYEIIKNKIELTPNIHIQELLEKITKHFQSYNPNTIDGVKIDFEQGWVHLRPSNTEPIIRIYAEAETQQTAEKLIQMVTDITH